MAPEGQSGTSLDKGHSLDHKSPTQSEIVYQGLRREILECRLLPGAKIKTSYVCGTYGVSLGAAREALQRLTADGMATLEAQKGFAVAPISWEEFEQLTETRAEIDASCLRKSIMHGDVEWESRLVAALHRLTRLHDAGQGSGPQGPGPAWLEAHAEFHRALVAACPNRCLLDLREMLYQRSERYRYWSVTLSLTLGKRNVREEHIQLAELAQRRDADAACVAITEHFLSTSEALLAAAREAGEAAIPRWRARKG
ncbi:GntR family transcriptional regulator [Azospirillum sp. RWY-5-1]|uniref:GntR family transcriptional regulator n=1 Tax=Azospirillum oleiclasticum TaxID=2735135 RepID=A0ABX2TLJ3_9PROT|nr:GntR family transcriptional regulator [Azospirillum oleiclasticum]NYZ17635.1 GntR family transcriptional regulator [Azospirillum oleiclasticum]NYZ24897.1 GntR family transcriptional regulator [Azospirillum oleiclasticum]